MPHGPAFGRPRVADLPTTGLADGECWLKHQPDPSRPYAGAYNAYPAKYRQKHRTTPEYVQWMSGVLSAKPPVVDGPHWHW